MTHHYSIRDDAGVREATSHLTLAEMREDWPGAVVRYLFTSGVTCRRPVSLNELERKLRDAFARFRKDSQC